MKAEAWQSVLDADGGRARRYLAVAVVCALLNNVILISGDALGAHYMLSTILAFMTVTPIGYLLHAQLTFSERPSWRALMRFSGGVALGFPLFFLTMAVLCSGLRLPMILAAPIATVILFVWNYATARWAIMGRLLRPTRVKAPSSRD